MAESIKQKHRRWRAYFNTFCMGRDKKCKLCDKLYLHCDKPAPFDVHHITPRKEMPNGGYAPSNGIFLCGECHEDVEYYLQCLRIVEDQHDFRVVGAYSWMEEHPQYAPGNLYKLIHSSEEQAQKDSENLI